MSELLPTEHQWAWTEERLARLRELEAMGWPTSRIAAEMGTTKNTVTGKLSRLGLRRRMASTIGEVPLPKAFIPRPPLPVWASLGHVTIQREPRKVLITSLEAHHCRWPLDLYLENIPVFCGLPKIEGSPYCYGHHQWSLPPNRRSE